MVLPVDISLATNRDAHLAHHKALHARADDTLFAARSYGVMANNIADDTAAMQSMLNDVIAAGGGICVLPPGRIKLTAPLVLSGSNVQMRGQGATTILNNAASDVFIGTMSGFTLSDFAVNASGGHIFHMSGAAGSSLIRLALTQSNIDRSIWEQDVSSGIGSLVALLVDKCSLSLTASHNVPGWHVISSGNCNANVFRECWCTYSGNYVFWIEDRSSSSWAYDNHWINCTLEACAGGSFKLLGCCQAVIDNCHEYDIPGTYNRDVIFIGKSDLGTLYSIGCQIRASGRRGGSMALNTYDINVDNAKYTTILDCLPVPTNSIRHLVGASSFKTSWINDIVEGTAVV